MTTLRIEDFYITQLQMYFKRNKKDVTIPEDDVGKVETKNFDTDEVAEVE